ncbi:MAG: right-handed parallel beta-helix repeat-containing protein [Candidatus Binatia bacterium]
MIHLFFRAPKCSFLAVFLWLLSLSRPALGVATIIYVDPQIASTSCVSYAASLRTCEGGNDTAYKTIAAASSAATPGTLVYLRGGSYDEPLDPENSGTADAYITFKNYAMETVYLGGAPAIDLGFRRYIWLEGLHIEDRHWLESNNADMSSRHYDSTFERTHQNRNYNVIKNCVFRRTPAEGTTGNIRFVQSHYNQLVGNTIDSGNDNVTLIASDHNLVADNVITEGHHSLLSLRCANFNVIRGNQLSNTQQKIAEVYDCGQDTHAVPSVSNATKHNLFENNVFSRTSEYYSASGGNGIQYSGQEGIIRRNVFYSGNIGLGMQYYEDEALYNVNNRIYHNVFYNNEGEGISLGKQLSNNEFKNNILFANQGCHPECSDLSPGQIGYLVDTPDNAFWQSNLFQSNNLFYQEAGQPVIEELFGDGLSVTAFNNDIAEVFLDTLEVDPLFVNAPNADFHLQSNSPLIDAGAFLTTTTDSATEGTVMQVKDARYFYDGFGLAHEQGDAIQLQGEAKTVRITKIDYDTNTLTLATPVTWTVGQGVTLPYVGRAPDIGAFESHLPITKASLENPAPDSFQSGIGLISGWVCEATRVELTVDGHLDLTAAYGTKRDDTYDTCGDTNNGFGLLVNWNLLGTGAHTVRVMADGVEIAHAPFSVATLGLDQFPRGLSGTFILQDFPHPGQAVQVKWEESVQNFVITNPGAESPAHGSNGPGAFLENPEPGSSQSGIGLISGWICDATRVDIDVDGRAILQAAYGTQRSDTQDPCGDTNNGYGLLVNWNLLGDGRRNLRVLADGVEVGTTTFTVSTLGLGEFARGLTGLFSLPNFPSNGWRTQVEWNEGLQNFVVTDVQ